MYEVDEVELIAVNRVLPSDVMTGKSLPQEGEFLYLGLSEASAETICRAHHVEPLAAVQS